MLDDIINLVKQHAGDAIINNPAIPNENNEAVTAEAGSSIMDGLKGLIAGGRSQDVLNLFSHTGTDLQSNPAVQNISGGFVQNLIGKFGLDPAAAQGVAGNLIPQVLQSLVHKTNDTADSSFNLENVIGSLTNGQGIQGLLGGLTQGQGGGAMDTIKGFFK